MKYYPAAWDRPREEVVCISTYLTSDPYLCLFVNVYHVFLTIFCFFGWAFSARSNGRPAYQTQRKPLSSTISPARSRRFLVLAHIIGTWFRFPLSYRIIVRLRTDQVAFRRLFSRLHRASYPLSCDRTHVGVSAGAMQGSRGYPWRSFSLELCPGITLGTTRFNVPTWRTLHSY